MTGHNTGGLECEVNHIRGFIPISQVTLYRVEDLSEFVGQHFTCLVTEANPDRRNLVLSRRAILEQEKAEAKQKMLAIAPARPDSRWRGAQADGFRRVCRYRRRRRRTAARQPIGLGPGKTSQRSDKRRAENSRARSTKSILKPAKSASLIAICWKIPGPRRRKNIRRIR